jgi:hypothetical protein
MMRKKERKKKKTPADNAEINYIKHEKRKRI